MKGQKQQKSFATKEVKTECPVLQKSTDKTRDGLRSFCRAFVLLISQPPLMQVDSLEEGTQMKLARPQCIFTSDTERDCPMWVFVRKHSKTGTLATVHLREASLTQQILIRLWNIKREKKQQLLGAQDVRISNVPQGGFYDVTYCGWGDLVPPASRWSGVLRWASDINTTGRGWPARCRRGALLKA